MTKVIDCSGMGEEGKTELKPIEFTHCINSVDGWSKARSEPRDFKIVQYLGKNEYHGDMFSVSGGEANSMRIYKGHFNDGVI